MDRKSKVNYRREKSDVGRNNSPTKEEALEKLRGMEWARNKQDNWHLSRPRNDTGEKKKYDKDNYFDGKGDNQKNKRTRKPQETPVQPMVPAGFFKNSSEAPPVNAWAKKKGSALFNKPPEQFDLEEDDEILKLALEESLRTAELDRLRNMERSLYGAKGLYTGKGFTENKADDLEDENNYNESSIQFDKISNKTPDLHFIDTDSIEDLATSNQRRRLSAKFRRSESPKENVSGMEVNNRPYPSVKNSKYEGHPSQLDNDDNMFESSRPIEILSPASNKNNINHAASQSTKAQDETAMIKLKRPIGIPENFDKPIIDNLSANLKSTLTFEDTKGLLDNLQLEGGDYKSQSISQSHQNNLSVYETKRPVYASNASNASASTFNLTSSIPSENDILIHSFLRHDPPLSVAPDMIFQETERPAEVFPHNASQQYFSPNLLPEKEIQSLLNGFNSASRSRSISIDSGQSSNSSISNSPLQNVSPYGSLDKHIVTNPAGLLHTQPQNVPFHPLGPINVQNQGIANKLQEPQLASHLASQVPYPGYSPGFVTHTANPGLHLNAAISPYQLHNSNMMMPPSFSSQDVLNPLNQAPQTAQHLYPTLMLHQQQQNAAISMNELKNSESFQKVQHLSVFGQLQTQLQHYQQDGQRPNVFGEDNLQVTDSINHPPMNTVENQSQVLAQNLSPHQLQMTNLQNQPSKSQVVSKHGIPIPKPDVLPVQYQQPHSTEQGFQLVAQSKEEIFLQYQKAQQHVEYLRQLLEAHGLPQAMSVPHPLLIPNTHPMAIGVNSYYVPPLHAMPQSKPVPVQLMGNTEQLSPDQQDTSIAPEVLNMIPNADIQTSLQPKIGKGRGRLIQDNNY